MVGFAEIDADSVGGMVVVVTVVDVVVDVLEEVVDVVDLEVVVDVEDVVVDVVEVEVDVVLVVVRGLTVTYTAPESELWWDGLVVSVT